MTKIQKPPRSPEEPESNNSGRSQTPWVMREPRELEPGEESNPVRTGLSVTVLVGLFALLWFGAGPRYFLVVVGILVMIFLHELGHFMTARWTGMKATQFFMFMGPRIFSFRRGETEYGLRALPVGAFVRIVGMNNLDPYDPADEDRAYKNKSFPRRMLVITAGSIMHFIQALILFIVLSSVIGVDNPAKWSISEISMLETGETPAVTAGLQPGDTVVAVNGVDTTDFRDLQTELGDKPDEEVTLTVLRDGVESEVTTTLAARPTTDGQTLGFLGVAPIYEKDRLSPLVGVQDFGSAMWQTIKVLPGFLSPSTLKDLGSLVLEGSEDVSLDSDEAANRPISMIGAVRFAGSPQFDWTVPIFMLALINIFVGVFNLLPFPPLDGGHAAVAIYERLRSIGGKRHEMDVAKLLPLTWAVVFVLMFLMATTVWLDLFRPIS